MIYAGIGSRTTPVDVIETMENIADNLGRKGWTLRTGGAPGADDAFFTGAFMDYAHLIELFLPWDGFNNFSYDDLFGKVGIYTKPSPEAYELAAKFHPAWNYLKWSVKKLIARNSHQVLGWDLKTPADCIICWTKGGNLIGGTAQALRIAEYYDIPVYNLGDKLTGRLLCDIINA